MTFEAVNALQADGLDRDEGYRAIGRQALEAIEAQMAAAVERYLQQLEADDVPDRRNDYRRHLPTELGVGRIAVIRYTGAKS